MHHLPVQHPPRTPVWATVADRQDGIVSRGQLLAAGLTPAQARRDIENGRWRVLQPGVYATFTGPISERARVWSAVLAAGRGAAASHHTALWLGGLLDEPPTPVHVSIPASRRVVRQPGIRIHLSRALDRANPTVLHPAAAPPRIRLEAALLDQCETDTARQTTHLVLSAIQRRLTTADRIITVINGRSRHRWRGLITDMLAEATAGVASPLELRYRRDVEIGHALPTGVRNHGERGPSGGTWYRDVRYPRWRVLIELDGREAHPTHTAFRDLRRDNWATVSGDATLRYGWRDIAGDPCAVAVQVALVLASRGWGGRLDSCHAQCRVPLGAW